jgi:hypothetical protein
LALRTVVKTAATKVQMLAEMLADKTGILKVGWMGVTKADYLVGLKALPRAGRTVDPSAEKWAVRKAMMTAENSAGKKANHLAALWAAVLV